MNTSRTEAKPNYLVKALRETFGSLYFWLMLVLVVIVCVSINGNLPVEHAKSINAWAVGAFAIGWFIRSTIPNR